jgi:hypothetical protein
VQKNKPPKNQQQRKHLQIQARPDTGEQRFDFDKGHVLHASHEQVIRTKQCVLIFNGRQPKPTHGKNHLTKTKTDSAVLFAAYRPEPDLYAQTVSPFSTIGFHCASYLIHGGERSSYFKNEADPNLETGVFNMRATHHSKVKFSNRGRAKDMWTKEEILCALKPTYKLAHSSKINREKKAGNETRVGAQIDCPNANWPQQPECISFNDCRTPLVSILDEIFNGAKLRAILTEFSGCSTATRKEVITKVKLIKSLGWRQQEENKLEDPDTEHNSSKVIISTLKRNQKNQLMSKTSSTTSFRNMLR